MRSGPRRRVPAAGELCDETKSARQLTDLDAIALFISEQLASAS